MPLAANRLKLPKSYTGGRLQTVRPICRHVLMTNGAERLIVLPGDIAPPIVALQIVSPIHVDFIISADPAGDNLHGWQRAEDDRVWTRLEGDGIAIVPADSADTGTEILVIECA